MDEVLEILEAVGLPYAYHHFAEGESPEPHFICYLMPASDNFAADGKVKVKIPAVQDGEFGTANICASESWGYHIELKNVTAVIKPPLST